MRKLEAAWVRSEWAGLALVLLAALAFGVLRALTVPAGLWNIDESYHFGDVLNTARFLPYEIGRALGAAGPPPAVLDGGTIPNPSEIFRPPGWLPIRGTGYLLLQAGPQALLEGAPAATRLFVARLVSVLLHLVVIVCTYALARQLAPGWAPLASAVLAAFVPGVSDMMSGVNVDVGAAAAGALYLAAFVRVLHVGPRPGNLALLALGALLGISVKETFWPMLPATGLAVLWGLVGWRWRLAGAAALAALAVAVVLWVRPFTPGGAAYWFDAEWKFGLDAALASRVQTAAPVGQYALRIQTESTPLGVLQYISERRLPGLRGQTIVWGAWLRADRPTPVDIDLVAGEVELASGEAEVGTTWAFHAFAQPFESAPDHMAFRIRPSIEGTTLEADGMVVTVGDWQPEGKAPVFRDAEAGQGEWAGHEFENLLLNASAESNWLQVLDAYNVRPRNFNTRLNAVMAWQRTLPAVFGLGRWLLANFWSSFGGLLPGLSPRQLIPLAALTAWAGFGVATLMVSDVPRRRGLGQRLAGRLSLWALLAASVASWLVVLYRSDFVPNTANVIIWSVSRHASAGLAATLTLLALGMLRWLPRPAQRWAVAVLALGLFAVNAWILLGVQLPVYHCALPLPTDCLPTVHGG